MSLPILSTQEFYTSVANYMHRVDPTWDEERWQAQLITEQDRLGRVLGKGNGRSLLDCSCGSGGQAIPLAKLGWHVTATDITEASLTLAQQRAQQQVVSLDFQVCDMRHLPQTLQPSFDWAISCNALDNLTTDEDIQQAINGMFGVLKPGGKCYIRQRNFDNIMHHKPHYDVKEERYESNTHVLCIYIFLWEDQRKKGYRWTTDIFSFRRRAIRKVDLKGFLKKAGFKTVEFLPPPSPWIPYEVIASA